PFRLYRRGSNAGTTHSTQLSSSHAIGRGARGAAPGRADSSVPFAAAGAAAASAAAFAAAGAAAATTAPLAAAMAAVAADAGAATAAALATATTRDGRGVRALIGPAVRGANGVVELVERHPQIIRSPQRAGHIVHGVSFTGHLTSRPS